MQYRYPFTNELYLVRTNVKIPLGLQTNSGNHAKIVSMSAENRFKHFLKFINKEYNIDLLQNPDKSINIRNQVLSELEETKSEFNKVHDEYSQS